MKLYWYPLSGHSHRVRLLLSLLNIEVEMVEIAPPKGENRTPEYLAINRFGQIPVLEDDGLIIPDSNAILVYIAKKYGSPTWLPEDALGAARVQRWLSVAAGEIAYGPNAARLVTLFGASFNPDEVIARSHKVLALINAELEGRHWIAADHATIADIALYAYVARAPEGNVDRYGYGNVTRWLAAIEQLPGFVQFAKSNVGMAQSS